MARALADDFSDGVTFVSLSNVTEPPRVPHAVAAALELKEVAGTPIEEVVSDGAAKPSPMGGGSTRCWPVGGGSRQYVRF